MLDTPPSAYIIRANMEGSDHLRVRADVGGKGWLDNVDEHGLCSSLAFRAHV